MLCPTNSWPETTITTLEMAISLREVLISLWEVSGLGSLEIAQPMMESQLQPSLQLRDDRKTWELKSLGTMSRFRTGKKKRNLVFHSSWRKLPSQMVNTASTKWLETGSGLSFETGFIDH